MRKVRYAWSLVIAVALIAVVGGVSSLPGCDNGWLLLLPGALLAAVVFPQGVNSKGGVIYLVLAGLIDIALLGFLVMWIWGLIERRGSAKA
jgi:hypothetical protein